MNPRPVALIGLVAVVVGVIVGLAEGLGAAARTPAGAPPATLTPLVGVQLVCPDVADRTVGHVSRITRVGVAAAPQSGSNVAGSNGVVSVQALGAHHPASPVLRSPGSARILTGRDVSGDVVVTATGRLAGGLAADAWARRDGGPYRGIDAVSCGAPTDSAWLIGARSAVGAHAELHLTNIDPVPALVDIAIFAPSGPVNTRAATGLAVGARSTRVVRLESVAPGQRLLMVHVVARSGRVAVALRQQVQSAATPQGQDWIPIAQPPATTVVVPGIAPGSGPRQLLLGNPGEVDATASIRVLRPDAAFVPRGLAAINVPAGSVVSVDLTTGLGKRAGAAVVTADHPIVAGGLMSTGPQVNGFAEEAFTAATTPLTGAAVATTNYLVGRYTFLLLSTPAGAADVQITTLPVTGLSNPITHTRTKTVHMHSGRTLQLSLASFIAAGDPLVAVSVTPLSGGGPVYVARESFEAAARSALLAVVPMRAAPTASRLPAAAPDFSAGLPR